MKLKDRLFNVLRKNAIVNQETRGKYRAALTQLVKEGRAKRTEAGWELPLKLRVTI